MALPPLDPPFDNKTANFIIAIEVNIAAGMSWWPYLGNLARLTRNERVATWPNLVGIFGAAVLGEIVGLLAAVALGNSDPTIWMAQIGGIFIGIVALAFVAFANITSMANILYTSLIGLRQVGTAGIRALRWETLAFLFCVVPLLLVVFAPGVYDGFFKFLVWTSAPQQRARRHRHRRLLRPAPPAARPARAACAGAPNSAYGFWRGFNPIGLFSLAGRLPGLRRGLQPAVARPRCRPSST